ncbi:hypothetical protein TWF281_001790 [Arthrobotrys megalospora]
MFESQPIHAAATACRKSLSRCLSIPRLKENGWADNRLVDFNLWAAGAGVFAKGKLSLDQRLSTKPEVQNTLVNLLDLLQMFVENCHDQAKELDRDFNEAAKTERNAEPVNTINLDADKPDEISPPELSSEEIETRRDVEVTLDQIIRLTVAIRKAGSDARLKRADRSFNQENPKIQELKGFLELLVHPKGFKEEGQLTSIQQRLVEANLRRWHRFSYAKLHSKKLARSDTAPMKRVLEAPAQILEDTPQIDSKPTVSFDIPEIEEVTEITDLTPEDDAPRAVSVIAPTATTAASAIEGNIIVPDKPMTRAPATVISRVSSKITYPRPPTVSRYNTVFKCPCCLQSLPVAYTERSQWKKHLASDILPYTCIFPDCQQPLQLYLTRKDWEHHIKTEHGQLWKCAVCEQLDLAIEFSNEDELVNHLRAAHNDSVDSDEIPMFVTASSCSKPLEVTDCPLCTGPIESENSLEHIAHCVHDFSLNSLPLPSNSDAEDDYFDVDSRNSDSQNTPSSFSAEERDIEGLAEWVDDTSSVEDEPFMTQDEHKVSESSLKALVRDSSGPKGISILDWRAEPATDNPEADFQADPLTATPNETAEEEKATKVDFYGPRQRARYRVAWLCVSKIDAEIAEALLDSVDLVPPTSQASSSMFDYCLGRVEPHIVVVAWPSETARLRYQMDKWCLATEVAKVFRCLEVFLHVGTAAGIPSEVNLGNVVVGPVDEGGVLQYNNIYTKKKKKRAIQVVDPGDQFKQPPGTILMVISKTQDLLELGTDGMVLLGRLQNAQQAGPHGKIPVLEPTMEDVHFGPTTMHIDGEATCMSCYDRADPKSRLSPYTGPKVYYDGIACGKGSIEGPAQEKGLLGAARLVGKSKVRCVETEGGLLSHADTKGLVVIRGIGSYTDKHKDIRWKKLASASAAVYAKELLRHLEFDETNIPPPDGDDYGDVVGLQLNSEDEDLSTVETHPNDPNESGPEIRPIKCLFLDLPCPYMAPDFDSWVTHIKKHLIGSASGSGSTSNDTAAKSSGGSSGNICGSPQCGVSFICSADYNRRVQPVGYAGLSSQPPRAEDRDLPAQPLSWTCGFKLCDGMKDIPMGPDLKPDPKHLQRYRQLATWQAASGHKRYQSRNFDNKEEALKSKLEHIYKHIAEDGWDLDRSSYEEEDKWIEYFKSIPVTLLEPGSERGRPQDSKSLELELESELKEICERLTPIYFQPMQEKYSQTRMKGTLLWFLELQEFKEWKETAGKALLCTGLPGAGKTYITAFVYDTIRTYYKEHAGIGVIYYDEATPGGQKMTTDTILRCILKQFMQQIGHIQAPARQSFYQNVSQTLLRKTPSINALTIALKEFLGVFSRNFILIDGLDENELADGWEGFLDIMESLQADGVSCFYTSRQTAIKYAAPQPPVPPPRAYYTIHIEIDGASTNDDIEMFLDNEFSKCPGMLSKNTTARKECVLQARDRIGGSFLIAASFAMHVAAFKPKTMDDFAKALLDDPFCDALYNHFSNRISLDTRPDASVYGLKAAALVGYVARSRSFSGGPLPTKGSKLRDYSRREFEDALCAHVFSNFEVDMPERATIDDILSYCHGLLVYDASQDTVRLFHPTAEQYFERSKWTWYPGGQTVVGLRMLNYLYKISSELGPARNKKGYAKRLKGFPYFRRASKEWGYFLRSEPEHSEAITIIYFLRDSSLTSSIGQVLKVDSEGSSTHEIAIRIKGIHLAAYYGMQWAIEALIYDEDVDVRDQNKNTVIAWAIEAKQPGAVFQLARHNASFTDINYTGSTALLEAIRSSAKTQDTRLVREFVLLGAPVNEAAIPSESYTVFTPLTLAILHEQNRSAILLLAKGANPNEPDGRGRTPLICAVKVGDMNTAQLLIDHSAELEAIGGYDGLTALGCAVSASDGEMVKLLIEKGANVNAKSKHGDTMVDLARERGNDEMANFLIEKGGSESPRTERIRIVGPTKKYELEDDFPATDNLVIPPSGWPHRPPRPLVPYEILDSQ